MMNSCLEKPCPWGFAFHRKYPVQLDYSGSFRCIFCIIIWLFKILYSDWLASGR